MVRTMAIFLGALALQLSSAAMAQAGPSASAPPSGDMAPADYSKDSTWLCRPGMDEGTCSTNLDAVAIDAKGNRTPVAYKADPNAPIDCFYVYPTASRDASLYSDLTAGPEERDAVHRHVARLGSLCRVFAPVYRQVTVTALVASMNGGASFGQLDFNRPYADVLAAWRHYLAHDNHGRGVVLVGHSQGAMMLKRLIAEEIDGQPAQKRLVAAYLSGNPSLTDKSFRQVLPCTRTAQTGCVVGWSSALDYDKGKQRFGGAPAGSNPVCVNAAAPSGGRAVLKAYLPKPATAPQSDPPFVAVTGGLSAECVAAEGATLLRVHIEPGAYEDELKRMLGNPAAGGWGLHTFDVGLVQGNMLEMIAAQSGAWRAAK